jgi:Bacterial regulatory proteins, luxR family
MPASGSASSTKKRTPNSDRSATDVELWPDVRGQQLTTLVLQGSSTIDIADRPVISVHTVRSHVRNVFTKAGVRARRDLVTKISLPATSHASETMSTHAANRPLRGERVGVTSPQRRPRQAQAEPVANVR